MERRKADRHRRRMARGPAASRVRNRLCAGDPVLPGISGRIPGMALA